jgi:hypothetical protein
MRCSQEEAADMTSILYFAFVGPWVRRPLRPGEFSYVDGGLGALLFAFGLVTMMEGAAVHLILRARSPLAAWALTAVSAYTLVWLVALHQAARLRPVLLAGDRLILRTSLLWTLDVPVAQLGSVTTVQETPRGPGVLRAALGTQPTLLLTLKEPAVAQGPFGVRRSVTRVALYVDDAAGLTRALSPRLARGPACE